MNNFPRFDLQGKTALVTGAARGLGRAISLALANAGADVALGLRDVKTGSDLVREIQQLGRKALPLQMDMSRLDQSSAAIRLRSAHFIIERPKAGLLHIDGEAHQTDASINVSVRPKSLRIMVPAPAPPA